MNIAVCDDEPLVREHIKALILRQCPEAVVELYNSGEELLSADDSFDILFLDIQMEGMNGIEAARIWREKNRDAVLIFITAIKEYVFDAFDVSAFHYLLKPVEEEKLAGVLRQALNDVERGRGQRGRQLFIRTRNRHVTIPVADICFIECQRRKVEIHTVRETLTLYATMSEMERQLGEDFYRCHRGYLVNMAHIAEYASDSIQMNTGERVYLSKEKYPDFVRTYMHYLRKVGILGV